MPGLAPHQNAAHRARCADAQRRIAALDLERVSVGQIRQVPFAGMDYEKASAPRGVEHPRTRLDRGLETRDIVAERRPEAPRLQEVALHVDDDERHSAGIDRERLRLRCYGPHWHGSLPMSGFVTAMNCKIGATSGRGTRTHRAPPDKVSLAGENDVLYQRIDLVGPAVAAEHAVMPDPGLHVMALEIGAQSAAQVVRGRGLADRADVVALALDREQHGAPDRPRLDPLALPFELADRQRTFLKDQANGLQVEFRRQVEHREVLVVEGLGDLRLLELAFRQIVVELPVRLHVTL